MMTEESTDKNQDSNAADRSEVPQTAGSFFMSVAFWCVLLTAALMYAAVSLSPKLADWITVRQQHAVNAARLQEMEDEADYLERVSDALKTDPAFAQRLVHATQSGNPEQEFVPVTDVWKPEDTETRSQLPKPLVQPAVAELIMHLASHQTHRTWLLIGASGLTVLAFTLLNDSGKGVVLAALHSMGRLFQMTVARYQQTPSDIPVSEDKEEGRGNSEAT